MGGLGTSSTLERGHLACYPGERSDAAHQPIPGLALNISPPDLLTSRPDAGGTPTLPSYKLSLWVPTAPGAAGHEGVGFVVVDELPRCGIEGEFALEAGGEIAEQDGGGHRSGVAEVG